MQSSTPVRFVIATFIFTLISTASAVAADKYPPCDTFVLHGGAKEIAGLDLGPKGPGLSDERITKQELFDAEGDFAGVARLVHIVVEPIEGSDEGEITVGVNAFSLQEGTIYGQVMMEYPSDFYENELPRDTATIAVVGGTGAFVRSGGQIVATFKTKTLTPTSLEFQLYCD